MVFLGCVGLISCSKNEQLSVHYCAEKTNAISCDMGCVISTGIKYSFLINSDQRSVMQTLYEDGEQRGSLIHNKCIIFDERNWDCSSDKEFPKFLASTTVKMVNGKFISYLESYGEHPSEANKKIFNSEKFLCAKRVGFWE